ncbi:MAG: hypothetical protein M1820_007982 [Bogoriella megaspora]|nr:MAG: hypothetical protein M1820_007982 [Bogoriella megaspora]
MKCLMLLLLAASAASSPTPKVETRDGVIAPRNIDTAPITLPLTRKVSRSISHAALRSLGKSSNVRDDPPSSAIPIQAAEEGQVFLTAIQFGSQTFNVVLDTGSSDTWLVRQGYTCVDPYTGASQDPSACDFAATYDPSSSSTFHQIPEQNFNISYGDAEFGRGIVGVEDITIGDITVTGQEIAVMDYAAWFGDGESSGILGLAYPSITSAWEGDESQAGQDSIVEAYQPIFTTMIARDLIQQPIFSLAIYRTYGDSTDGGYLCLGGLPDPNTVSYSQDFATVPIETTLGVSYYMFYTITVDGFNYGNATSKRAVAASQQAIVDSGTTLMYLPSDLAHSINSQFNPPADYDEDYELWNVDCNAIAPDLSLVIGGKTFTIYGADLVVQSTTSDYCSSGVQEAIAPFGILGDVFLKNVVAVFDVGNSQMRFAART